MNQQSPAGAPVASAYEDYRVIIDLPSQNARLGFENVAKALATSIESSRPQFAIGIFGPWGSGKTTLMQAIERNLTSMYTVPVRFSAWRYEREDYLLIPLLDTIRESLLDWAKRSQGSVAKATKAVGEAVLKTATTIGRVVTSLVAGMSLKVGLPGALEFSFEANDALDKARELGDERDKQRSALPQQVARRGEPTFPQSVYHAVFRQLSETFDELRKTVKAHNTGVEMRFVVFVDDLDRCLPQSALEVLEAIKLFFDMEGFIFVVGLDRSVVERFVEQRYAQAQAWTIAPTATEAQPATAHNSDPLLSGQEYIKKIFQVPFNLAPVQLSQLTDLIDGIATEGQLSVQQTTDLNDRVRQHLAVALDELAVNPREVKRYINSYTMQMKITPHLNPDVVLAIQTIKARLEWKAIYDALVAYRDEFLTAVQMDIQAGQNTNASALDDELSALPRSFLTYIGPAGAARAILDPIEVTRIAEYLYSIEATTTSHGTVLLDIVQLLSSARRALSRGPADKATLSTFQQSLLKAQSQMSSFESVPVIKALAAEIGALASQAVAPKGDEMGGDAERIRTLVPQLSASVGDIIQRTRTLRRQNQL